MFKKLLSVGGFTLLSRITGFVRDALLAWTLGAGILSDAFFVAFLFPNYFRAICDLKQAFTARSHSRRRG